MIPESQFAQHGPSIACTLVKFEWANQKLDLAKIEVICLYNTIQYNNTVQYNTIQYSTMQHNTTQHNTIQYNTTHHKLYTHHAMRKYISYIMFFHMIWVFICIVLGYFKVEMGVAANIIGMHWFAFWIEGAYKEGESVPSTRGGGTTTAPRVKSCNAMQFWKSHERNMLI